MRAALTADNRKKGDIVLLLLDDITGERKVRGEEMKKLAELDFLYNSVSSVAGAVLVTDVEGTVSEVNKTARELLKKRVGQIIGKNISHLIPAIDEKKFGKICAELRVSGRWSDRVRFLRHNGDLRILEGSFALIPDEEKENIIFLLQDITRRIDGEEKLYSEFKKFRTIALQFDDPVAILNNEGNIEWGNDKFTSLFGNEIIKEKKSVKTIIEKRFLKIHHFNITRISAGREKDPELPIITGSGEKKLMNACFYAGLDINNEPEYYLLTLKDGSLKKEKEKTISILKSILNEKKRGLAIEMDGVYYLANRTYLQLIEAGDEADIRGKSIRFNAVQGDKQRVEDYHKKSLAGGESGNKSIRYTGMNLEGKKMTLDLKIERKELGGETFFIHTLRDITTDRSAESTILSNEKKFSALAENINIAIWATEQVRGRIKPAYFSGAIEKITGYSNEEFLEDSRLFFRIIHPDDYHEVIKKLRRFLGNDEKKSESFNFRIISKNGNVVWIENKVNIEREQVESTPRLYGSVSDISANKKAEEELKKSAEDLKKLNETKDRFISIVSHDLRTPFSSIIGFTDVLLGDEDLTDEKREEYVRFIRESSGNMLALVNSLLDWTRLQTGRMKFEPQRINARRIAEQSIQIISGSAMQKEIELISDLKYDIFIHADENLLMQVFNNLISNAVKFTHPGGEIRIESKPIIYKKMFEFAVKDNGVGIKEDDLAKLFRIDTKFTTNGTGGEKGSGLGLSLCHDIVTKHGGEMRVTSERGKGTTFYFTLPVSSTNILFVDDSGTDRILYSKLISNIVPNYQVILANNGREALQVIEESYPALIVSDHRMPVLNGLQLVSYIRDGKTKYRPPVIILSSDLNPSVADEYREMGVEYVFNKPVNLKTFKVAIDKSLKKAIFSEGK